MGMGERHMYSQASMETGNVPGWVSQAECPGSTDTNKILQHSVALHGYLWYKRKCCYFTVLPCAVPSSPDFLKHNGVNGKLRVRFP